jgi:energy-coupling factor transport system ATP-binding protein
MTVVDVRGLHYRYPGTSRPALDGVDLQVAAGSLVGVIGSNGSGKSTLLQALVGLVPHVYGGVIGGRVRVAGFDVAASSVTEVTRRVGIVFANPVTQLSGAKLTVREELAFGLENAGVPRAQMLTRIAEALSALGLEGLEDRDPFTLSGGQLQRVALASMLVLRPEVLVLDEPTSQLDPAGTATTLGLVAGLAGAGMTVVIAEHEVDWLAAHADTLVGLAGGRVVAAGPARQLYRRTDLAAHGLPVPIATRLAWTLGWRRADGSFPVTPPELRDTAGALGFLPDPQRPGPADPGARRPAAE